MKTEATTLTRELKVLKFVKEPAPLESLFRSRVVEIRRKINEGIKLSREEKNYITECCIKDNHSYSISLMGWKFSFSDILKKYLVNDKYNTRNWSEYYAVDVTSLREAIYDNTCKIIEFN
jgi:hypothetical protein